MDQMIQMIGGRVIWFHIEGSKVAIVYSGMVLRWDYLSEKANGAKCQKKYFTSDKNYLTVIN